LQEFKAFAFWQAQIEKVAGFGTTPIPLYKLENNYFPDALEHVL